MVELDRLIKSVEDCRDTIIAYLSEGWKIEVDVQFNKYLLTSPNGFKYYGDHNEMQHGHLAIRNCGIKMDGFDENAFLEVQHALNLASLFNARGIGVEGTIQIIEGYGMASKLPSRSPI